MVKVKLTQNETTKQYEWTIVEDEKNQNCFDIITPTKNRLIISNVPYLTPTEIPFRKETTIGSTEFNNSNTDESTVIIRSFREHNPILCGLYVIHSNTQNKHDNCAIFHPITKHWIRPWVINGQELVKIAESIQIDMINHILEFDRQEQLLKCLEHLATRQTIERDMNELIKNVGSKVSPDSRGESQSDCVANGCRRSTENSKLEI